MHGSPYNKKVSPPAHDAVLSLGEQRQQAGETVHEIKQLLTRHETLLRGEGLREKLKILESWVESYQRGLNAADRLSESGLDELADLRDRLRLAAEERQRLESEGGQPANREQVEKTEEIVRALKRIENIIPKVEHMLSAEHPDHDQDPLKGGRHAYEPS